MCPEKGRRIASSLPLKIRAASTEMLNFKSPQLPVTTTQRPKATGDLWQPSGTKPTTVPVPLPVVVVRVDGPFTALDRKLWLALVHIAFPNLDKPGHIHEISIAEIIELFRKVSGRRDLGGKGILQLSKKLSENTDAAVLWQSIRRLAKTTIEWEDDNYMGINSLLGARIDKRRADIGQAVFHLRSTACAARSRPARLGAAQRACGDEAAQQIRRHALRGSRSLREPRKQEPASRRSSEVRGWLKVPDDAYRSWKDFRRNVVDIAVEEINTYADLAGFRSTTRRSAKERPSRKSNSRSRKQTAARNRETQLGRKAKIHQSPRPCFCRPCGSRQPADAFRRCSRHVPQEMGGQRSLRGNRPVSGQVARRGLRCDPEPGWRIPEVCRGDV